MKPWYWEMERAGWGPHYYLTVQFVPENESLLVDLVSALMPEGFELEPQLNRHPYSCGGIKVADNAVAWIGRDNREWRFASVILTGAALDIECGGGAYDAENDAAFARALLSDARLTLHKWSIYAGGGGYGSKFCRSGTEAKSLLRYMEGEVSVPDWARVEKEVRRILPQHDPTGKFTLSECRVEEEGETMSAILLYDVPRSADGAWLPDSGWEELIAVAREVGELCQVPYSALGVSIHAPDNWQHITGGSITFGIRAGR